ncbi:SseB family protein [Geomonas sp. Red32]|uniref:SseB family protein n=1 Tax=Geomonas sp. Red32 TaxID=2912856 RepID=UPI00202CCC0A|nr:SseB family protein [Geomonas sp. Red32]MCM0082555.1 SseB family protein [Geomonas sp. Red32]
MTPIDEALAKLRENAHDPKKQSQFYDLFLNSTFFIPILGDHQDGAPEGQREIIPVITQANGNDYLMLFDTMERMVAWIADGGEKRFVEVPGHMLTLTTTPPLHWALNVGTEYTKEFLPNEIDWLREAVEKCNAQAAAEASENCCG